MGRLSMCRICLMEESGMHLLRSSYLIKTYEKLTEMPFETEDGRPIQVCYICVARLKSCHHLRKTCLRSEELLTQVLSGEMINIKECHIAKRLAINHPMLQLGMFGGVAYNGSIVHNNCESIMKSADLFVDVKVERDSDDESENIVLRYDDTTPDSNLESDEISQMTQNANAFTAKKLQQIVAIDNEFQNDEDDNTSELSLEILTDDTQKTETTPKLLSHGNQKAAELCIEFQNDVIQEFERFLQDDEESSESTREIENNSHQKQNEVILQTDDKDNELQDGGIKKAGELIEMEIVGQVEVVGHSQSFKNVCPKIAKVVLERIDLNNIKKGIPMVDQSSLLIPRNTRRKRVSITNFNSCVIKKDIKDKKKENIHNKSKKSNRVALLKEKRLRQRKPNDNINNENLPLKKNAKNITKNCKNNVKNEKRFHCNVCDKYFRQNETLRRHSFVHSGLRPFKCDICQKTFKLIDHFKQHKLIHTGQKPYKCETCNKCFRQTSTLRTHCRTHTGFKPYSCKVCETKFSKKDSLNKHMMTHTTEKPYICEVCARSFSLYNNLVLHLRIHKNYKPYNCSVCDRRFTQKIGLYMHQRLHTDDKPYMCDKCKRYFRSNENLLLHFSKHAPNKPYKCETCKKYFIIKDNYLKHLLSHNNRHNSKKALVNK